jgi:hypothetical protein
MHSLRPLTQACGGRAARTRMIFTDNSRLSGVMAGRVCIAQFSLKSRIDGAHKNHVKILISFTFL